MSQSHNVVVDPAFRGIAGNMTGFQVYHSVYNTLIVLAVLKILDNF